MEGEREKIKGGSSGRKQDGDESGRERCFELDAWTSFAGMSESSDSDNPVERDPEVSFKIAHPPMVVEEAPRRPTYKENMDEKGEEYAGTRTASHTTLPKRETRGSTEGSATVGLEKPAHRQHVEDRTGIGRKTAEPRESRQRGNKTGLLDLYYRRVARGDNIFDYDTLRQINLMAPELLSHSALNWRVKEVPEPKWRAIEELASRNPEPERTLNELEATKKPVARLEEVLQGCKRRKGLKRGTAER